MGRARESLANSPDCWESQIHLPEMGSCRTDFLLSNQILEVEVKSLSHLSVVLCGAAIAACTPETQQVTTTETVTKVEVAAVEPSDALRYTSSPSICHAILIPVNLEGRVVGV